MTESNPLLIEGATMDTDQQVAKPEPDQQVAKPEPDHCIDIPETHVEVDSNVNETTEDFLDSVSVSETAVCRICHCEVVDEKLISPCDCCGSVKWVHESCLVYWMKSSFKDSCELCMKRIEIIKKRKSLSKWQLPTQLPTPVLWVLIFVSAIALNLASVVKDASRRCSTTPCLVFYAVGCIGVVLGTLFVVYWSKRARIFVNRWMEQNEEWVVVLEKTLKPSDVIVI